MQSTKERTSDQDSGQNAPNEGAYTLGILDNLRDGITPVYIREQAGIYAPILDLILDGYDTEDIESLNQVIDAMRNRHPAFDELLKIADGTNEKPYDGKLLSEVQPEEVRWLWLGRLPFGKLVMADGDPGLGKTSTLLDVGARLTRGHPMPGETSRLRSRGVALLCLEDGLADTIQPRMAKAGADLTKVVSIGYIPAKDANGREYERLFDLAQDLPLLEAAIRRVDAGLVIIDPVMTLLGSKDTYKDSEVRATLAPLKSLAEQMGVCIVLIRHLNKSGSEKMIYQGGGSIGFIGLARVGLFFCKNPDDEDQCVLAVSKNNLRIKPPKLLYRMMSDMGSDDERAYVQWDGTTTMTDQELTSKPQQNQGDKRNEILTCLKGMHPEAATPQQVAEQLKMGVETVAVYLGRMYKAGQIDKAGRGKYVAYSGLS